MYVSILSCEACSLVTVAVQGKRHAGVFVGISTSLCRVVLLSALASCPTCVLEILRCKMIVSPQENMLLLVFVHLCLFLVQRKEY